MRGLLLLLIVPQLISAQGDKDFTKLPGVNFVQNFDTYSGYLNAGNSGTWQMHYSLMTAVEDPDNAPILVWLNGGPGCSSFGGLFEELGPFYVDFSGKTLFQNVFAWNQKANLVALESPIGVGFSYSTVEVNMTQANDNQTSSQNYNALKDFFANVQPKYNNRTFYLAGESYAGIYIPMLSQQLVNGINSGDFPNPNFQGAAIGNGFMNVHDLMNSLVVWSAYHGRISIDDWDKAKTECKTGGQTDYEYYDYTAFMTTSNNMDYTADNSSCGQIIKQLITDCPGDSSVFFDQYNYYQDCYGYSGDSSCGSIGMKGRSRRSVQAKPRQRDMGAYQSITTNTAQMFNYDSTDQFLGYTCWNDDALVKYLRDPNVQNALHIPPAFLTQMPQNWHDCNDPLYNSYTLTWDNMEPFFKNVIDNVKTPGFRFLIYNGDVDTVCNYLGDSWFIRRLASNNNLLPGTRKPWLYSGNVAGYVQNYAGNSSAGNTFSIDVLTVKGAGHFVPGDRPGPALQMINNFMFPDVVGSTNITINYSKGKNTPEYTLQPMVSTNTSFLSSFVAFIFALIYLL